uniref:FBD domain-containing protein n=1 Tax=Steinernema glaseri TaxID=37863 RepID=A0A1I7YUB6_9BILA
MNSVPDAFLDAVCSHLNFCHLKDRLKRIQGGWSVKAAIHKSKRRELMVVVDHGRNEVKFGFANMQTFRYASPTLNAKYDRIRLIEVGIFATDELPESTSMECFKKKVLPVLRSLAFDCILRFASNKSFPENMTHIIFDSLHGCTQLTSVCTRNYGGNCPDFIKHQISLGCLKELDLRGDGDWPADLQDALRLFVNSPRFVKLVCGSNLTVDIYMVIAFVERFLRGDFSRITELQGTTRELRGKPSFPVTWLHELHRDKQRLYYQKPKSANVRWTRSRREHLVASRNNGGDLCLNLYLL